MRAGHQGLDFEVLLVKNLRGDDGSGQRRLKDRGDAGAQPCSQGNVPFPRRKFQEVGNAGAGGGTDLGNRPFPSRRETSADGDGRSDQLEDRRLEVELLAVVECPNRRVRANSRGLRSEFPGQKSTHQTGRRGDQREHPEAAHVE